MGTDYTTVTELPGSKVTREQLSRMCNRYYFASGYCEGKDVLEVACGAGQGLGYIAEKAKKVVGGDIDENILKFTKAHYKDRENIKLHLSDAQKLPFEADSFDVVILFEAIYYLAHPKRFLAECRRVFRQNGVLIICTANKDWLGFNPSPFSIRYFSAPELFTFLSQNDFEVELFGDSPVSTNTIKDRIIAIIRWMAVALHLIPKTMKGKEILKRIFFGKLLTLPSEIEDGMVEYSPPVPIPGNSPNSQYKVLFAVARVR